MKRGRNTSGIVRRRGKVVPIVVAAVSAAAVIAVLCVVGHRLLSGRFDRAGTVAALYDYWNDYDYQNVYDTSSQLLERTPLQNTALTLHGYSAFYLAVSQTDSTLAQNYLDEAVNCLRMSLQNCKDDVRSQIEYMLGKSYFYKDSISSYHYYADLAVRYLTSAVDRGYRAADTAEYLGLSYAALGQTQESIAAFTGALAERESDTLLFDIGKQYFTNSQPLAAKQYLYRVLAISDNSDLIEKSRLLMGKILIAEGDEAGAEAEFRQVLEQNENSADAHYELGVLYKKQGNMAKARSQWRDALKIQPEHPGVLAEMNE